MTDFIYCIRGKKGQALSYVDSLPDCGSAFFSEGLSLQVYCKDLAGGLSSVKEIHNFDSYTLYVAKFKNKLGYMSRISESEKEPAETALARDEPETNALKAATNPSYYKNYMEEFQWIDAMSRISHIRENPLMMLGALEVMARKYLDRGGRKDAHVQDILKAVWYLEYMAAYIKNGCVPITVKQVREILSGCK